MAAIRATDYVNRSRTENSVLRLPYEQLLQQGQIRQNEFDQNEAREYQLQSLMQNLKADPKAEFAKQVVDEKYNQRLLDLSTRVADKGDVDYKREINRLANEYNTDPLVQTIKQRKSNYDLYQADKIKNSDKYVDFYDPYLQEGDIQSPYSQTGQLSKFNYQGMDQRQDYLPVAEKLVSNIASSGAMNDVYERDQSGNIVYDALGQRRKVKRGSEGIARDRVRQVALSNAEPFLMSKEGRFFLHELAGRGGFDYEDLSSQEKRGVQSQAADYLAKLAEKQIGFKSTYGEDIESLREDQTNQLNTQQPSIVDLGDVPLESVVDLSKYQVQVPQTIEEQALAAEAARASSGDDIMTPAEKKRLREQLIVEDQGKSLKLTPEQKKIVPLAQKVLGRNISSDDKVGTAKLINDYVQGLAKASISQTVQEITDDKVRESENRFLFGTDAKGGAGITERSIKLIDGEGPKDGRGSELLKEYGNPKKYDMIVSGKLNPGNPFYEAGRIVKVVSKDGEVVARYAVSGNYSEKAQNKIAHEFYKTKYKPEGENTVTLPDGNKYKVKIESIGSSLDDEGRLVKQGEKAYLTDLNDNILLETPESADAAGVLYEMLRKK